MKIFFAIFLVMITSLNLKSYCQNSVAPDLVSGDFIIITAGERFNNMKKNIPQLICTGIFNRSDFVYRTLESLGLESPSNKQTNQQYNNRITRDIETSLLDSLDEKRVMYFINGNYSEFYDQFKFSFDLIDVKSKKKISQYITEYIPNGDIYKQIDKAAEFLQQAISLNKSAAHRLKNVAILLFNNQLDPAASSLYNIEHDFTASFAALNLKGGNKFNVLAGDKIYRYSPSQLPINMLFDKLNADIIVTGTIKEKKDNKRSKKLALNPIVYIKVNQVDTFYMPEQKKSLFFKNDLQNLVTKDLQSFLDEVISDSGSWDSSFTQSFGTNALSLLNLSNEALAKNNFSFASVMAFRLTQKQDSAWLGFNQLGNIELKRNNYDEAIDYFDRAIPLNTRDLESYEGKGKALLNKGLYDKALEQFQVCLKQEKKFPGIHLQMARCYFQMSNDSIFIEADLALKNEKDSGEIYSLLGKYYKEIKNSNFDSAIYYFQKAYSVNNQLYGTDLSITLLQNGLFQMDSDKYNEAVTSFLNSFKIDPAFEALDGLRYAFTQLHQYDSVDAVINLGLQLKLYDSAQVYSSQSVSYISLLDIDSSNYFRYGSLQKAIYYLDLESGVNNDSVSIYQKKARAYFQYGEKESATFYYKKILNADSFNVANYLNLAEVEIMNNAPGDAYKILSYGLQKINSNIFYKNQLSGSRSRKVVAQFLLIVSKIILNQNYDKELKEERLILGKYSNQNDVFIYDWSFVTFQKWLDSASIDIVKKEKIYEQLILLKDFSGYGLMLKKNYQD